MKGYIVFLFLLTSIVTKAQVSDTVLYVDESNNYHLLIEQTTKVLKQNFGDSHAETFVFTQNNQLKFSLTISRSKAKNVTNDSLNTSNFMQAYINNCGCEVLTTKHSNVNNINSVQFKIKRVEKGKVLLGYTDSFVVNQTLYNVVFMTLESNFLIYQNEYQNILSTFGLIEGDFQ